MIHYVTGDATQPQGEGLKILAHIVNNCGGWGAGFVVSLSRRWLKPEQAYRSWCAKGDNFALGMVQLVKVEDDIIVANMIAQHGYSYAGHPAIQYPALHMCLLKVAKRAKELGATIHGPRFGAGLAGGMWDKIEPIITDTMGDIEVFIYDLPEEKI